jgi:large conductance mechanosensitive channel
MPMLRGFRDFVLRGNLLELAVALVLGLAFAALVASLVDNLLMPVIAAVIGEPDFRDLTFEVNGAVFGYGAFLTDAIIFVATAAAVYFFVVRPVSALLARRAGGAPAEEEVTDEERRHRELLAAIDGLAVRR